MNAWVAIRCGSVEATRRNFIVGYPFQITRPDVVCYYSRFSTGIAATAWSVSSGFSLSSSSGASVIVTPNGFNGQTGTLTATVNGVSQTITIQAASSLNACWPDAVSYYWNDLKCNEHIVLAPPLPTEHPNATYRWEIMYIEGANFNLPSGTYSSTAAVTFTGGGGSAIIYAYLSVPPFGDSQHPVFEYRMSTVSDCGLQITGPQHICYSGNYFIGTSHTVQWSVTPSGSSGFSLFANGSSATVYADAKGVHGTVTAVSNGVTYTLPIYSFSLGNCPCPIPNLYI
jgi:hypothetical protein